MKKINSNNKVCIYLDQFVVSNLVSGSTDLWIEIKNLLEAKYEIMYAPKELNCEGLIELKESMELPVLNCCYPDNGQFCDEK